MEGGKECVAAKNDLKVGQKTLDTTRREIQAEGLLL